MGSSVKQTSGIRLQSNSAHFISLGNSRLSTEVTLFDLPIGKLDVMRKKVRRSDNFFGIVVVSRDHLHMT